MFIVLYHIFSVCSILHVLLFFAGINIIFDFQYRRIFHNTISFHSYRPNFY